MRAVLKKYFIIICFLAFILLNYGCGNYKIMGKNEIEIGEVTKLYLNSYRECHWESRNRDVVDIDYDGNAKGISSGKAEIIAYFDDMSNPISSFEITVTDDVYFLEKENQYPESIEFDSNMKKYLNVGEVTRILFNTYPSWARKIDYITLSNRSIVSVVDNTYLIANAPGDCSITIHYNGLECTYEINVSEKEEYDDLEERVFRACSQASAGTVTIINCIFEDDILYANTLGSGFIYRKAGDKYYILTNRHVVEGAEALQVELYDGNIVEAELVNYDKYYDLAVISIDAIPGLGVYSLSFGNPHKIEMGRFVIALGTPMNLEFINSASMGIISNPTRRLFSDENGDNIYDLYECFIQHDAAINPGNSGGPLLNLDGNVIGMNCAKIMGAEVDNMSLSISITTILKRLNYLESDSDEYIKPNLGISGQFVTDLISLEEYYRVPDYYKYGIIITKIAKNSLAKKYGLKTNDIILSIDNKNIFSAEDLYTTLENSFLNRAGYMEVKILRDNKLRKIKMYYLE